MDFRTQNARGKYNQILLDSLAAPITGKVVQLQPHETVDLGVSGSIRLKEHFPGQYAAMVEANNYSIFKDGLLQSLLSPICVPDAAEFDRLSNLIVPQVSVFGDGSDGDTVIDRNTHLTRDMYYGNLTVLKSFTGTGTVSNTAGGSTLTGSGTLFQSEVGIGDTIYVNGEAVRVRDVSSDTSLSCYAIRGANSGVSFGISVTLFTDNWRIFSNGKIRVYGRISNNGGDARYSAGGLAPPAGFYPSVGDGANGGLGGVVGAGQAGQTGSTIQNGIGLVGHTGGGGGNGGARDYNLSPGYAGGPGGSPGIFTLHPSWGSFRSQEAAYLGQIFDTNGVRRFYIHGNPGGGGGGGSGAVGAGGGNPGKGGDGGGAGANGGIVFIACRELIGDGMITSNGGDAGYPQMGSSPATIYSGAGGGGGWPGMSNGGIIYLSTIDDTQFTGLITAIAGIIRPDPDPVGITAIGMGGVAPPLPDEPVGKTGEDGDYLSIAASAVYPEPPDSEISGQFNYVVTSPNGINRGYFIKPYSLHTRPPRVISEIEGNAGYILRYHIDT